MRAYSERVVQKRREEVHSLPFPAWLIPRLSRCYLLGLHKALFAAVHLPPLVASTSLPGPRSLGDSPSVRR